jgi:EpsI family protein
MTTRVMVVALVLACGAFAVRAVGQGQPVPLTRPFWAFPASLGSWNGRSILLEQIVEREAGVSSYLLRVFTRPEGRRMPVQLYVGFYESQSRAGVIHSPTNCLPGGGWFIARRDKIALELPPFAPFEVNKFVISNGLERRVVLYWYQQSGGRIVTNDYLGRVHLVLDAVRHNRTDAAIIRVIVPTADETEQSVEASTEEAVAFLQKSYPELMRHLPHERLAEGA